MKIRALSSILFVCCLLLAACAAPRSIREASRLQLESLARGEEGVNAYRQLSDQVIERAIDLQNSAQLQQTAFQAVQEVLQDAVASNPLRASDQVAARIFEQRRKQRQEPSSLQELRRRHPENLRHLVTLLNLLLRSQKLIHECLTKDVGPEQSQIEELRQEITKLRSVLEGGR